VENVEVDLRGSIDGGWSHHGVDGSRRIKKNKVDKQINYCWIHALRLRRWHLSDEKFKGNRSQKTAVACSNAAQS